jgi:hypothetical protein
MGLLLSLPSGMLAMGKAGRKAGQCMVTDGWQLLGCCTDRPWVGVAQRWYTCRPWWHACPIDCSEGGCFIHHPVTWCWRCPLLQVLLAAAQNPLLGEHHFAKALLPRLCSIILSAHKATRHVSASSHNARIKCGQHASRCSLPMTPP